MSTDTYVLGIACFYHDSSACLLKNGEVLAAAEEERFTRVKHDASFPSFAIEYCMNAAGIDPQQLTAICFYEKPFKKFERILYQYLTFPPSMATFKHFLDNWLADLDDLTHRNRATTKKLKHAAFRPGFQVLHERFGKLYIRSIIANILKFTGPIYFCEHHQSHAASAYYNSHFSESAVVTIDGVGEWSTLTYGLASGNKISLKHQITYPHSLGLLYSTITAYLGFSVNNSEYKVMGLSSYGEMRPECNPYLDKMSRLIDVKPDGSFRLDLSYFAFHRSKQMFSDKLSDLFEVPPRKEGDPVQKPHMDIAAALQIITEQTVFSILNHVQGETNSKHLCFSGGVALNSVLNGKILENTEFEELSIHPASGDGGASLGAAYFCNHQILGQVQRHRLNTAYLGPSFSQDQIEFYLNAAEIKHQRFSSSLELVEHAASLIANNQVIGWFQGGMEWGPRALGARSILANPCNPDMQEILNLKVKHREAFRPFAPAVCAEDANTYFECDQPLPDPTQHMLMVYPVRERWRDKLPSITHVDGSGRLQVVHKHNNPRYWALIKAVGKLTGIPMLINTSFNIRGEPIVCTPDDAYRCMMGTGIDALVVEDSIVFRDDNPLDQWDSESLATD